MESKKIRQFRIWAIREKIRAARQIEKESNDEKTKAIARLFGTRMTKLLLTRNFKEYGES